MADSSVTDPPLPQLDYTQMIMTAMEELNGEGGVNRTAISSYIEENNPDLPPAHSSLLATALDKMRSSGQLAFANNNYSVPDPLAPPKRGRGRPPKRKSGSSPPPAPAYVGPPRSRGRPPKLRDPLAPPPQPVKKTPAPAAAASSSSSGRPRGRPRKDPETVTITASLPVSSSGVKRGRGRPRKNN